MKLAVCLEPRAGRAARTAAWRAARLQSHVTWVCAAAVELWPPSEGEAGGQERLSPDACVALMDARLQTAPASDQAAALAALLPTFAPDYVLTGVAGDVRGLGIFPAALAFALGWPLLSQVSEIAHSDGGGLEVWVETAAERLCVALEGPAVLACAPSPHASDILLHGPPALRLNLDDVDFAAGELRCHADETTLTSIKTKSIAVNSAPGLWQALNKA